MVVVEDFSTKSDPPEMGKISILQSYKCGTMEGKSRANNPFFKKMFL